MFKILIADDEMIEREMLIYLLNTYYAEVFEVFECNNGEDALTTVIEQVPDLLILDIQMPGLTGLEVLQRARESGYRGQAVFLTAYDSFEYAVAALKLQAKDYIVKPIIEQDFINVIEDNLERMEEDKLKQDNEEKKAALLDNMESSFLKKMVLGQIDEEILQFFKIEGMPYEIKGNCLCVKIIGQMDDRQKHTLNKEIKLLLENKKSFTLTNLQNDMLTILCFDSEHYDAEDILDLTDRIKEEILGIMTENHMECRVGCGCIFEDLSGIEESYNCAREMLGDIKKSTKKERELTVDSDKIPKELVAVETYLKEHYPEKITLEQLAEKAGFTKYYLSRLYKKYYQENIMDCLIRIRMEKAKEILMTGQKNIRQIGLMVGYADPNYFNWSFKKYTGETPLKYQQRQLNQVLT